MEKNNQKTNKMITVFLILIGLIIGGFFIFKSLTHPKPSRQDENYDSEKKKAKKQLAGK